MVGIQEKYGCLTVLDNGEGYLQTEAFRENQEQQKKIVLKIEQLTQLLDSDDQEEKIKIIRKDYPSSSFARDLDQGKKDVDEIFDSLVSVESKWLNRKLIPLNQKLSTHYKCQCKCGKVYYYDETTILSKPKYCFYPLFISRRPTYDVAAQNATYRKREKYGSLENVFLCSKEDCYPSDQYCDLYNIYRRKQLGKREEKFDTDVSKIPRVLADNFDQDYTGRHYESFFVERCIDEYFEAKPIFDYAKTFQNDKWRKITVYKKYQCKCILCGKEQEIYCSDFGIYPPTGYGSRAYDGYWSEVLCDCHSVSSFQWVVNKVLWDNGVNYMVEYSFPDLYGSQGVKLLRFDFAIFNNDGSLRCLIECQGEQHFMPIQEFGGKKQFQKQQENDDLKRQYVHDHGIPLIEIGYKDKQIDKVKKILMQHSVL